MPITRDKPQKPQPLAPRWYRDNEWVTLPDDCRVKCEQCRGHGCPSYFEMMQCFACLHGEMACPSHACPQCHGSGRVCPTCRGMRFIRGPVYKLTSAAHDSVRELQRCPDCCEGNNINPEHERKSVERYLVKWWQWVAEAEREGRPLVEPRLLRQRQDDAENRARQQEFEATQAVQQRSRQQRHISRSKQVEAKINDDLPPLPMPTQEEWAALRSVVTNFRKPKKERAE